MPEQGWPTWALLPGWKKRWSTLTVSPPKMICSRQSTTGSSELPTCVPWTSTPASEPPHTGAHEPSFTLLNRQQSSSTGTASAGHAPSTPHRWQRFITMKFTSSLAPSTAHGPNTRRKSNRSVPCMARESRLHTSSSYSSIRGRPHIKGPRGQGLVTHVLTHL